MSSKANDIDVFYGALANRFVFLRRTVITHGHWRSLWERDNGATVSALPIMALLSTGHSSEGAVCSTGRLADLAGITKRDLRSVRDSIRSGALIELLPSTVRGRWRFRSTATLVPKGYAHQFCFLGALVDCGIWGSLTREQRNMIIVLAALAPSEIRGYEGTELLDAIDPNGLPSAVEDFVETMEEESETGGDDWNTDHLGHDYHSIRRLKYITWTDLAILTGMGTRSLRDNAYSLFWLLPETILLVLAWNEEGLWYHLPET